MIPRILHQIWLGPAELPEQESGWARRWAELHPGWRVLQWRAPRSPFVLEEHEGEGQHVVASNYAGTIGCAGFVEEISDIFRLEILRLYGGVYVDLDCQPLRPIDDLVEGRRAVASSFWHVPTAACCAFMGAEPGHPWIDRCLGLIRRQNPHNRQAFGSRMISEALGPDVVLLDPREVVNDSACDGVRVLPPAGAYAVHRFASTMQARRATG